MNTTTPPDAIEALAHRIEEVLPADVYLLNRHLYEGDDDNLHVAIIADADDHRINVAQPALAQGEGFRR